MYSMNCNCLSVYDFMATIMYVQNEVNTHYITWYQTTV